MTEVIHYFSVWGGSNKIDSRFGNQVGPNNTRGEERGEREKEERGERKKEEEGGPRERGERGG
jgi:hypothetical protein